MDRLLRVTVFLLLIGFLIALPTGCESGKTGPSAATQTQAPPQVAQKIRIKRADDLPQHTYPIAGTVAALLESEADVLALARKVRADLEADLQQYDIQDASTLQRMHGTLLTIALLERRYDDALALIEQVRALESKEATRRMIGLTSQAMIAARRQVGEQADAPDYKEAFVLHFAERVGGLPWDICRDEIQQNKASAEIFGENLIRGILQSQIEPVVAKTGELNADAAAGVLRMCLTLRDTLPLKDEIIAVYQAKIELHQEAKPDIWAARAITLSETLGAVPVRVAVWDSGTDPEVFKSCLFVNPHEQPDGQDTDGNGFIDDVHGIAYDIHARRTTGLLCPLDEAAERIPQVMRHMKGLMDMQAAIDSPEAAALKRHLASLQPEEVQGFIEDLSLAGNWAHGTHVAGIMVEGNPYVELLIARLSYDHRTIPVARTIEWAQRDAAKMRDTVEYFKQHGVRLVNMSWGEAQQDAEDSLEKNGVGASAEERREIARQVFALQRDALHEAIAGAPEILFICAAGNADNDVEFDQFIPSAFDLPNLLVVGAVNQAGEPTSFTSFGRTVQVYASGFEVESYVPGGQRMKMSGTSMASPEVANLAGKLLAIHPALTPTDVIGYIKAGADLKEAGGRTFLLLHPKRSVELLEQFLDRDGSDS